MAIRRPKSNKNPPILSHEFVITNHADILSFVSMIFILGLLFQINNYWMEFRLGISQCILYLGKYCILVTNPIASPFVVLQHNFTTNDTSAPVQYKIGISDALTISFYTLLSIIVHAIFQEFILDKQNRRLRLSKVKHSKFNESGQLLIFYVCSAMAGFYIVSEEGYASNVAMLWTDYPHLHLSYLMKYYFIGQLAYWIHFYPELYFQKVKRDEIMARVTYITLHLVFIAIAYTLSLQRLAIVLLSLHYITESLFHCSRLIYFSEKQPIANVGYSMWNVCYVAVRLVSITLGTLTFWYGLGKVNQDGKSAMCDTKRMLCLAAVCCTQVWLMWHFIKFHLKRRHIHSESSNRQALSTSQNTKIARLNAGQVEANSPMTRSRSKKLQ